MGALRRIRSRLVEIEVRESEAGEWFAIGIVRQGLRHEVGMSFVATGSDATGVEMRLEMEVEVRLD